MLAGGTQGAAEIAVHYSLTSPSALEVLLRESDLSAAYVERNKGQLLSSKAAIEASGGQYEGFHQIALHPGHVCGFMNKHLCDRYALTPDLVGIMQFVLDYTPVVWD